MTTVTLGSTGITVNKNGFGALPIQRVDHEAAARLLRRAYEAGINFFDTARAYTDSEDKIGEALADVRDNIYIATKSRELTGDAMRRELEDSLRRLKTDHVDIYQLHNPPFCPKPGDGSGLYEAAEKAKAEGLIRHIGITNHSLVVANEAIESGLYETLQFPFCYLASDRDRALVEGCRERNMGFIAMKSLSGGLITDAAAAYAFEAQFDNVLPIWGVQREAELEQIISFIDAPPAMTAERRAVIARDIKELSGSFCRSCGYCMPCAVGISIKDCARMGLMLRRAPADSWLTERWQKEMLKINDCIHCGSCASKCPYGLDTPKLLEENLKDYLEVLAGKPV